MHDLSERTIQDFGEQWTNYPGNEGFYGSKELLAEMLGPLLAFDELRGARVAEIGSGAGRIVKMLIDSGVGHVTATEPSEAVHVLRKATQEFDNVECLQLRGDQLPANNFDYVFCIGVLQFIQDPAPTCRAAFDALRPGGRFIVRVYSREGNEAYLAFVEPLRKITPHLPHFALAAVVRTLDVFLMGYRALCKVLPLPNRDYMNGIVDKLTADKRRLIIYDQLNPSNSKYYTRAEAEALLSKDFVDQRFYHHHGSVWSIIATKPARSTLIRRWQ